MRDKDKKKIEHKDAKNKHMIKIRDRLIASIDVSSKQEIIRLCGQINNEISTLKIGFEVIYSCGLEIIPAIRSFGYKIMLDSKLHDIPNTVGKAAAAITRLGVDKMTVHASGGKDMLTETREIVLNESAKLNIIPPLIFAVTVLTSLDDDDLKKIGFKTDYRQSVLNLARIACESGIEGIVCSPNEVMFIRENLGNNLYIATPGIRLSDDDMQDQKRISTPVAAIKNGADFIIVGRSITSSKKPVEIVKIILYDIEKSLN